MSTKQDDVILGEGRFLRLRRRNAWEFVERPHVAEVAVLIAVTASGAAVLVEQYREPVECRTIEWPAGLVGDGDGHDGEDLLAAANRELEEETGFRAGELRVLQKGPSSTGLTSEVITFIQALRLEKVGEGGGVAGEKIQVHLTPLTEVDAWLEARISDGCLIDPKVYTGLYFLQTIGKAG
jgi:ADP-ribose pyrophosphatase